MPLCPARRILQRDAQFPQPVPESIRYRKLLPRAERRPHLDEQLYEWPRVARLSAPSGARLKLQTQHAAKLPQRLLGRGDAAALGSCSIDLARQVKERRKRLRRVEIVVHGGQESFAIA